MIHFFPTFSRDAATSPFGDAVRGLGVPHRILAGSVRLDHRTRLGLLLLGLPRLAAFAFGAAVRSLVLLRPRPTAVVLGSDIEVLVFSAVALLGRLLRAGRRPRIVLLGFIFTARRGALHDWLHRAYYRLVLSRTDLVICHSRLEVERYTQLFAGCGTRFVHVPWGTDVAVLASSAGRPSVLPRRVVSAGRSGRDYPTLLRATRDMDCELVIVCDGLEPLAGEAEGKVRVLRRCHGDEYLRHLLEAAVVVVPLLVGDISAGQMVMIQAMACGRPMVVTDTPTTREYVSHGVEALLVPMGDAAAMAGAIAALLGDAALRDRLGRSAAEAFHRRFSTEAYVRALAGEVLRASEAG